MSNLLCIEIGGTKLPPVSGDVTGRIVDHRRLNVGKTRDATGIRDQIAGTLRALIASYQPGAIGVGVGRPVDHATGRIAKLLRSRAGRRLNLGSGCTNRPACTS